MKRLFILLFAIGFATNVFSQAADWLTDTSGKLGEIDFNIIGVSLQFVYPSDISHECFSAAPLLNNQDQMSYGSKTDWTVTFSSPIKNLRIYALGWRGDNPEGHSITYTFSKPITVLDNYCGEGITTTTNSITVPGNTFFNGIIQISEEITELSVESNSNYSRAQGLTFAIGEDIIPPAPPAVPISPWAVVVTLGLIGLFAILKIRK